MDGSTFPYHCARTRVLCWATVVVLVLMLLAPAHSVGAGAPARPAASRLHVRMLSIAEGLPHPTVYAIARDPFGFLWFGTLEGLARYDGHRFVVYRPDPTNPNAPASGQIDTLYVDRAGMLWIGTFASGLNRFDPATGRFTVYRHAPNDPTSISSDNIAAIVEDRWGNLWLGSESAGVSRRDRATGRFTNYRSDPDDPNTPGSNTVLGLYADPAGMLWAATWNGGLNRLDPATGQFTRYTVADGLLSRKINGIQPDDEGNLWLTSNQGLIRFDPRSGKSVAYPGASAGLPPGSFPLNGSARTRSGELILGGFDSVVTFFPREVRPQTEVAPVVFTDLLISNRSVTIGPTSPLTTTINAATGLTLSYRDRVLSLEFAALDYRAPAAAHYRYRLVGFEPGWVEADSQRRLATYTNLDPGVYSFELQAANGEGVWGTETRRLRITVVPPWWQTWWFTLLVGATLLASVVGGVGLRLRGEERQRRRLEAEVAVRTAALAATNTSLERCDAYGARRRTLTSRRRSGCSRSTRPRPSGHWAWVRWGWLSAPSSGHSPSRPLPSSTKPSSPEPTRSSLTRPTSFSGRFCSSSQCLSPQ